ncbi:MAG: T9SS type A sorting domain-containing protein, partial [Bacteroidales bacterium]|nr:T9SS type A sorting domain-containing protein [Bacteroidales bacterium]
FGLNDNFLIDSLEIIWPGGIIQRLENIPANQQLTVVEDSTTTGVFDSGARKRIILEVFPNPVDHSTTINYQLTVKGLVALTVYDIYGKVVATLVDNEQERGEYKFQWRISDNIIPGIYLLRLTTNQEIAMRKIIIK